MRTADERQNEARWWFDNFLVPILLSMFPGNLSQTNVG